MARRPAPKFDACKAIATLSRIAASVLSGPEPWQVAIYELTSLAANFAATRDGQMMPTTRDRMARLMAAIERLEAANRQH